ncbi:MAG: translocation/assembly module TamB domain-containing protein [Rikenellaceae bacterium]
MRKVTKILAKLLSATILLLIILPLAISLLLSLATVQNYVVHRVADVASSALGARVSVGRVSFSMLTDVTMRDILVEDLGGDTMVVAKSAKARVSAFSLLSKELRISSATMSNGELRLREVDSGVMNIKQIQEKLVNPETQGMFRTQIDRIYIENLDFSLRRMAESRGEAGVDLTNIELHGIDATLSNFVSHSRITELSVDRFSGVERSGLRISAFKGDFVTYEGVVDLSNMTITTDSSFLDLPRLRLESDEWQDYKDFNANVSIELQSNDSRLALSDVAYFAPELGGKSFEARALSFVANGTIDNLEAQVSQLKFGEQSSLSTQFAVHNVTRFSEVQFEVDIPKAQISPSDLEAMLAGFGAKPLEGTIRDAVTAMGLMEFLVVAKGDMASAALDLSLSSAQGRVAYNGKVGNLLSDPSIEGEVALSGLEVGHIIDNKMIGALDMNANVRYKKLDKGVDSHINGYVSSVGYNSCLYSDLFFDAAFDGVELESTIDSLDPKLDFDLDAVVRLDEERHCDLTMRINNADLVALALNHRDSVAMISGSMRVNMGYTTLDDLSGMVTLRNINYTYNDKSIYAPMVAVNARNSAESKSMTLESDYLDVHFSSKSSFEGLYNYLRDGVSKYIPMLYTERTERKEGRRVTIADNYSTLNIDFKSVSEISDAIFSGLEVANNSSFNLMVNPYSERFTLRFQSEYIEHGRFAVTGVNVNASNDKDSLSLYAVAADLFVDRAVFPDCTIMAGARNNVVEFSAGFRDSLTMRSATLGVRGEFESARDVTLSLLPSQVSLGDNMWMISARQIEGHDDKLLVDDFRMVNGDQSLVLDGAISKIASDSLTLRLDNYDIGVITSVVNDLGYLVAGRSNGYVHISQLLSAPRVVADVDIDDVSVNEIPSPPLKLSAGWNSNDNSAQVFVTNRHDRDTVMTGYYTPANNSYDAHLRVDSLDMRLLDPLLSTTITDTHGYANVDVTITGEGHASSVQGGIDLYDLSTRVLFTQVEYSVPSARIEIDDNALWSRVQEIYDGHGNKGLLTLNLSLDRLSNVSYMLRMTPDNMLMLNTTQQDNELFYGTLFATGVVVISGDKHGVDMDITATSQPNSVFYMPLTTKSSVTKTDFITFVQPEVEQESVTVKSYRHQFVEQRNERLEAAAAQRVNVSMALHATPDLDFQLVIDPVLGDVIRARGEGRLNLNIAPQQNIFEMYGDYGITEGNYLFTLLNPISKRFTIGSDSSIQWTGDPLDPQLDINAVYMVKTSLDPLINSTSEYSSDSSSRALPVDCIIHLGDRLSQPSVDFSIEVPTADTEQQAVIANTLIDQETISQQFFYLMLANSFVPVASGTTNVLTSSTTASTGIELLTNQLSNWLSSTNYDVTIRYRMGSDEDYTGDEVDLGFSRGLIDNRLLIEVEGNYQADNKASVDEDSTQTFMGEAYVTWLIDKAGSLRLKGFTQTIDRYDENQGLQETGVGIYFSESFDTFSDLKRKIFDRFRRKKNKKREEV